MTSATTFVESSFTNCLGDEWVFIFDKMRNRAFLKGSDVEWDSYPVFEGVAYGLNLTEEEKLWLVQSWQTATKEISSVALYLDIPAELVIGKSYTSLSDDYCPICLERKIDFEIHHCIWAANGGPNTSSNLLRICNSCHAIITRGSTEDRIPKDLAAFHHQVMYFGFDLLRQSLGTKTNRSASNFSQLHPRTVEFMRSTDSMNVEQQDVADRLLRTESRIAYQYFRDLGLKKLSWSDHERLFAPLTLSKL